MPLRAASDNHVQKVQGKIAEQYPCSLFQTKSLKASSREKRSVPVRLAIKSEDVEES